MAVSGQLELKELISETSLEFVQLKLKETPEKVILRFGNDSCYFINTETTVDLALLIRGVGIEIRDYRSRPRGTTVITVSPMAYFVRRDGLGDGLSLIPNEVKLLKTRGVRRFIRIGNLEKDSKIELLQAIDSIWKIVEGVEVVRS